MSRRAIPQGQLGFDALMEKAGADNMARLDAYRPSVAQRSCNGCFLE